MKTRLDLYNKWSNHICNYSNIKKLQEDESDCLYVLYNKYTGYTKIGITNNTNRRFKELSLASGVALEVLIYAEFQVDYDETPKEVELFLHKYFENKRILGEWFNLSLRDFVEVRNLIWRLDCEDVYDYFTEKKSYVS